MSLSLNISASTIVKSSHAKALPMKIRNTEIGLDRPVYFIAEIGSNFDGDINRAKDLIEIAKDSGANAVKFQHYTADSLVSDIGFKSLGSNLKTHQSKWEKSVSDIYDAASLDKEWTADLLNKARSVDIDFFTSPYSIDLLDYVLPFIDAVKIGSGDITFTSFLKKIAKLDLPILIATGASNFSDVDRAMSIFQDKHENICIMQCNTNYEGNKRHRIFQNLNVLTAYKNKFPRSILGLSCHMPGWTSVLGAVSLGARVIEKHFTDDRTRKGPDHGFAINPLEWSEMVKETRALEEMLGDGLKKIEENEKATRIVQQRCIRAKRDLMPGEIIKEDDVIILRPCPDNAFKPYEGEKVLGKKLKKQIQAGQNFTIEHL